MIYRVLRTLFGTNPGEGSKLAMFALLGALLQAGIAIGISASDSLLLSHVGPSALPLVYLLTPLVMLSYIPAYSYLTARWGTDRTLSFTLLVLAFGGSVFAWVIPEFGGDSSTMVGQGVYIAAKLYSFLWYIALYTLYWNFIDRFFDILDAKRVYSLLAAGCSFGAILGGGIVSLLSQSVRVETFFLIWSLLALLCLPVAKKLRLRWVPTDESEDRTGDRTMREHMRGLVVTFRASAFAKTLAAVLFTVMVLSLVIEYQYLAIFSASSTDAELADLFGKLFVISNLFTLAVNLLLFNRLVRWFGVRNLALVQPIAYLGVFAFLIVDHSWPAAVVGFFAFHGILTAIDFNNTNLLLNALPDHSKKHLRTFIEGMCEPMATAVAGAALLYAGSALAPEQISLVGLVVVLGCLALVVTLRALYVPAMIANLKRGWIDFSREGRDVLAELPESELQVLCHRFSERFDRVTLDDCVVALSALWGKHSEVAEDYFMRILEQVTPADCPRLSSFLSTIMQGGRPASVHRLLDWYQSHPEARSPEMVQLFSRFGVIPPIEAGMISEQDSPQSKAAMAAVLRLSRDLRDASRSFQLIESLMGGDADAKREALRVIGAFNSERYAGMLSRYVRDNGLRRAALQSLLELSRPGMDELSGPLLTCLGVATGEERMVCLEILARLVDTKTILPLLAHCARFTPRERRAVERVIRQVGLKSIPSLTVALRSSALPVRCKAVAARSLALLSAGHLELMSREILRSEIARAYADLEAACALRSGSEQRDNARFLAQFYTDRVQEIVEYAFEVLSLQGSIESFELILNSLRSPAVRERGNAIETIHERCSREMQRLLLPLVDGRPSADAVRQYNRRSRRRARVFGEIVIDGLLSSDPLEISLAADLAAAEGLPNWRERATRALGTGTDPRAAEVLLDLLSPPPVRAGLHWVERMKLLAERSDFAPLPVRALAELAYSAGVACMGPGDVRRPEHPDQIVIAVSQGIAEANGGIRAVESSEVLLVDLRRLYELADRDARVATALIRGRSAESDETMREGAA